MSGPDEELHGPRASRFLVGHEAAAGAFVHAWASGRMPHAWLITGPHGVGKATLAYHMAAFALAGGGEEAGLFAARDGAGGAADLVLPTDHPVARRVRSGGHSDLVTLERGYADRSERRRTVIGVDEVRAVGRFLHLTAAEGGWRVVVVDSADDLSANSANALLKFIEEPPPNVLIILISDSPYGLLPTIRSRCRRLALGTLSPEDVGRVVATLAPDADTAATGLAIGFAEGSPGRALNLLAADGIEHFEAVMKHLALLPRVDLPALDGLGDRVARSRDNESFRLVFDAIDWWLTRAVRRLAEGEAAGPEAVPGEHALAERLGALRPGLDHWLTAWENVRTLGRRAEAANLDRKQAIFSAFTQLQSTFGT